MGHANMQVEFPESLINKMRLPLRAEERAQILLDFAIKEIDVDDRKTVAELYKPGEYTAEHAGYIAVALIQSTGEHLIVPPGYGRCNYAQKNENHKPPRHIKNHAELVQLINGEI